MEKKFDVSLVLANTKNANNLKLLYEILCFCKEIGAVTLEIEFVNPDIFTGKDFVNPVFFDRLKVCVSLPGERVRYEKPKRKEEIGHEKLHYLKANFDSLFIEWYKENSLMTFNVFNLQLFDKNGSVVADFTDDQLSIHIYSLSKQELEKVRKIAKKYSVDSTTDTAKTLIKKWH
ncbi:MAG: hypothetical protein J4215_04375 [Candidatus Diapherotrites archaeon]|uniref:Uncharacterized protein n=1 Tax=Candidatus Iainarchaeum sp. TaxID=3101447 RepID=A0A8T4L8D5_9ARCH|nr:hypothetical protein [Candidatus Diapherotrites archaeon]